MNKSQIYYSDKTGIVVTNGYLRTKFKDQSLAPITSMRINRDPFYLSLAIGAGFALFAMGFGDLLYLHEQAFLALVAVAIVGAGHSVASLQMGTTSHEKTMLWGSYGRMRKVRDAVIEARRQLPDSAVFMDMPHQN